MRSFPRVVLVLLVLAVSTSLVFAAKTCRNCGTDNKDSDRFCKSCGARLPEAPPSRPAPPRVAGSVSVDGPSVRITSEPSGAGVNIDGQSRGRTPLVLNDLDPGRHEVELTRSGYRPYYGEFTLAGSFGSIVVTTEPVGAEVLLNGESRGPAPDGGLALVRVPYGRHEITARLHGYNDAVKTIDLKSAGPIGVTCRLGYGKGWLVVKSEPPGANLHVNDQATGKTPYTAELEPARYALSLTRPGYYNWTGDANVQFAESTAVRVILDRIQTRKAPFLFLTIASLGAGVGAAVLGQSEYASYRDASTPEDALKYRRSTTTWDVVRNVTLGAGIVLGGVYWTVKW